jgi:hypothetical protein
VSAGDPRGDVVEVFTLPSWRVNAAGAALCVFCFVCGLFSVLANGAGGLGLAVLVAGVLGGALVGWSQRNAPRRLVVRTRGFEAGRRFVPWEMIRQIEARTPKLPVYRITLDFGGGYVLLPSGAVTDRAFALIEELRRRAGGPAEPPGPARPEDPPPTPA